MCDLKNSLTCWGSGIFTGAGWEISSERRDYDGLHLFLLSEDKVMSRGIYSAVGPLLK